MPTVTQTRRRVVIESAQPGPAKLKIDREKGIIYGVRIGGRFSRNTHGVRGVEGTEYSRAAYQGALPLYEGAKVRVNHPVDYSQPNADRDVGDSFGIIRNPRVADEANGDWHLEGDLHYLTKHRLAESVIEDVERGLGVYGLSHHAYPGRERVVGKRNVIESIVHVGGVDLVDKPGTNRNLWESAAVESTEPPALHTLDSDVLLTAALDGKVLAIVHDDSLSPQQRAKKIAALIEQFEDMDDDSPADPMRGSSDAGDDDAGDRHTTASLARQESYRRRIQAGERRVRELAEREAVKLTPGLLRAGALLESDVDRLALLREFKPTPTAAEILASAHGERPLRRGPMLESQAGRPIGSSAGIIQELLARGVLRRASEPSAGKPTRTTAAEQIQMLRRG